MIPDLETAIVERLGGAVPGIRVEAFPEDPASYALKHPRGAVLVGYGRSTYGKPEALGVIAQERRLEFDITVLARNLRQHDGAYAHLEAVRVALTGWRPPGARKLYPLRDRFLGVSNGVWRYVITIATSAVALETAETEQAALLRQITLGERLTMGDEP
ncbi:Gp37 family protein [Azospirillum halopraeferens]|uniref:Gp37 family protein n=1 Tax=Azospirillum halopraeferens TaxID=34010 RepID=UPI0004016F2B|nr:Gp37 family protein [Azospirillum halopraeferens]